MDYIIIVAGGRGTRMGTDIPKQFLKVAGKPVLMHTIERFHHYDPELGIIVVLPKDQQETWKAMCTEYHFDIPHRIADGGSTRFESSKNGLALVPDDEEGVVGFHDGVRPFVSEEVIANCFEMAREEYTAVPVVPVTDTLRHTDPRSERTFTVDRNLYRAVQTPQVFDISLAKQAFNQPERQSFTDDASVVESLGISIKLVDGNKENIKITTPFDLKVAEILAEEDTGI